MKPEYNEFQVFVKPAGPACNLRCSYCYYLDKAGMFPAKPVFRMEDDLLELFIKQLIDATNDGPVFFAWHGGEPLLAGIDFYRKAVAFQKRHLPKEKSLINGIQTNGTLLNEEWCRFLAEERFMVGISMDGPGNLHDVFRKDATEKGTFDRVIKGIELLQKHGISPEILCVVNAVNVRHPLKVYRFFKSLGVKLLTFLPLVEKVPGSSGEVTSRSVPAEEFGRFLVKIFDEWAEKDVETVQAQIFEETMRTAFLPEHTLCIFKKECGRVPVVEFNGDCFSCDHFVDSGHYLGNIRDQSLEGYLECPVQKDFGIAKAATLPEYCRKCEVLDMCNGECPKNRFINTPDGEPGLNYLCAGYKHFFHHTRPFVEAIKEVFFAK